MHLTPMVSPRFGAVKYIVGKDEQQVNQRLAEEVEKAPVNLSIAASPLCCGADKFRSILVTEEPESPDISTLMGLLKMSFTLGSDQNENDRQILEGLVKVGVDGWEKTAQRIILGYAQIKEAIGQTQEINIDAP